MLTVMLIKLILWIIKAYLIMAVIGLLIALVLTIIGIYYAWRDK